VEGDGNGSEEGCYLCRSLDARKRKLPHSNSTCGTCQHIRLPAIT
jgi:hypothetical protein